MVPPPPQAFELATGDYLFEPHSGEDYSRDEGETIARAGAVRTSRVAISNQLGCCDGSDRASRHYCAKIL